MITVFTRTDRFRRSAIPAMTDILNNDDKNDVIAEVPECEQCNITFTTDTNLKHHLRFRHTVNGMYPVWSNSIM